MAKKQNNKKSRPSAKAVANKQVSKGKPSASGTKAPAKATPKEKTKRVQVEPAGLPVPSADGWPNPILVSNRNKRALCIAFAHLLGGAKGTDEQDELLMKAVRESGVLWKSGMTIENFNDAENNSHLSKAEQSGRGYAMRCGRGRHDDYMQKYPEKVADCVPFATAYLEIIKLEGEDYQKARDAEMAKVPELLEKIAEAKAAQKAKPSSKAKATKETVNKKPAANKVVNKKPAATRPKAKKAEAVEPAAETAKTA